MIVLRCSEHPEYDGTTKPENNLCSACLFMRSLCLGCLRDAGEHLADDGAFQGRIQVQSPGIWERPH